MVNKIANKVIELRHDQRLLRDQARYGTGLDQAGQAGSGNQTSGT